MKNKIYNFNWNYIEFYNFDYVSFLKNLITIILNNNENKTILFSVLVNSKEFDISKSITKILVFNNDISFIKNIYDYALFNYSKEEYKEISFDAFIFRYTYVNNKIINKNSIFFKDNYKFNLDNLDYNIPYLRVPLHPENEILNCNDVNKDEIVFNGKWDYFTNVAGIDKYIKEYKDIIKFDEYEGQKIIISRGYINSINNNNPIIIHQFQFNNKYLTFKSIQLMDKVVVRDCHLDILVNNNFYIRKINNKTYYINKGEIYKYEINYKTQMLTQIGPVDFRSPHFLTLDIETLNINNKLFPYAIGFYDGKEFQYEYGDNVIENIFKKLLIKKYNNHVVYVHNLSKFDYIYLLDQLSKMNVNVEIIPTSSSINIVKFIIKYEIGGKLYKINFHDSYQILSSSLDKLCKSFDVPVKKSIFPYDFMDSFDKINYMGRVPDKWYYNKLPENYDNIKQWDAKKETLEYLKNDCVSLYQIIDKFSQQIHLINQVDIIKYPTLPSIAMGIFRTKYYSSMNIANIKGKLRDYIQNAYYGGIVDVYKPQGKNLYCYDVNSLYPFAMLKDMPIGNPTFVLGKINLDKFFGFLNVKIEAPDLNIPFLPRHHNGFLITPIGKWQGVYFSEELKYAEKLGYKIEILDGIQFNKGKPFNDYVNDFYELKSSSDPIKKMIAKLLLNSLYGRMGMSEKLYKSSILNDETLIELLNKKYEVELLKDFKNNKYLYKFKKEKILLKEDEKGENNNFSNVGIAAAITAYARIEMYKYKNLSNNPCYYSDTDSVFLEKPLNEKYISTEIGKLKLEYIAEDAIFLGPKNYYVKKLNGDEISKIKGYSDNINYNDWCKLLKKDFKLTKYQHKFIKNLDNMNIECINIPYNIQMTFNKRIPIFNDQNIFIDTKPINILNN